MGHIHIRGLGKAYKHYTSRARRLVEFLSFGALRYHRPGWVLRNVSFDVPPGQAVGIIGQNGAGKSTLLKLITGTTAPTEGTINVGGRVSALLELGIGFHGDFTGRQNVVMAGQLLGYSAAEIAEHMKDIEAFADIGTYIEEPVRTYSSGMQVRLAFSVATAIRPDVLIVDEALSVGDVYFQQKCFDRIRAFKKAGTTLLFVSHDLNAVHNLCDRGILLEHGAIVLDGTPKQAIDLYQARLLTRVDASPERMVVAEAATPSSEPESDPAATGSIQTGRVAVEAVTLSAGGERVETVVSDAEVVLAIRVRFFEDFPDPHVGFKVRDRMGNVLFETNTYCMGLRVGAVRRGEAVTTRFGFRAGFTPGDYTITVGVANEGLLDADFREVLSYRHEQALFRVLKNHDAITWCGVYNLAPAVEIARGEAHRA
jgi:lipopolysaccharide transport system ATP-binding protein